MKKILLFLLLLLTPLFVGAQASSKLNNSQNVYSTGQPRVIVSADTLTSGLWRIYPKNSVTWNFSQITNKPTTLNGYGITDAVRTVDFTWANLAGKPTFHTVAFTGNYNDLSNQPVIPTNNNQLSNGSGYITASSSNNLTNKSGNISMWTNDVGYLTVAPAQVNSDWNSVSGVSEILNKPNLSVYYLASNPNNYISSYTETDPIWSGVSGSYRTKVQNDLLYQPIGSYLTSESDPLFDIKFAGKTTTNLTEGSNLYFTNNRARTAISLTTTGSGVATYDNSTGILNVPNYTNVYTAGSGINIASNVVTNTAPDQTVTITAGNEMSVSGTYPNFTVAKTKRQETYSGTTNASGVYTVTFSTPYSVAPNIQANITNQSSVNQYLRVSSVSTTGFTINVFQRNSVNLLGIDVLLSTVVNVNASPIDVLISEK